MQSSVRGGPLPETPESSELPMPLLFAKGVGISVPSLVTGPRWLDVASLTWRADARNCTPTRSALSRYSIVGCGSCILATCTNAQCGRCIFAIVLPKLLNCVYHPSE